MKFELDALVHSSLGILGHADSVEILFRNILRLSNGIELQNDYRILDMKGGRKGEVCNGKNS